MHKKRLLKVIAKVVDFALLIMAIPSAYIMKLYRTGGGGYFPVTTRALKFIGVMPVIDHYYEPFYDSGKFSSDAEGPRALPGIDFNVPRQLFF
jgi:hypothetical protein